MHCIRRSARQRRPGGPPTRLAAGPSRGLPRDLRLIELKRWSTFNPGHDVVTVTLDLKERARDLRQFPRYLDVTIEESLGRDRLFTPGDLMGTRSSLVEAAMADGWPPLSKLAGRFVLCLSGDEATKRAYARNSRIRLCFADRRHRSTDRRPSLRTGDRIFFNINASESWQWDEELRWFARQRGLVTRAYGVNSDDLWQRVVGADANIVATDKVRNHSWAKVGSDVFARISPANRPPGGSRQTPARQ